MMVTAERLSYLISNVLDKQISSGKQRKISKLEMFLFECYFG